MAAEPASLGVVTHSHELPSKPVRAKEAGNSTGFLEKPQTLSRWPLELAHLQPQALLSERRGGGHWAQLD